MEKIQLILPTDGMTNWGNAINKNFIKLSNEQNQLKQRVESLRAKVDRGDIINLDTGNFIYLSGNNSATVCPISQWSNPSPSGTTFTPQDESDLNAYVVRTANNVQLIYNGVNFVTDDILYVVQDTANNRTLIRRWANSVGGYYIPAGCNVSATGEITVKFIKQPALLLNGVGSTTFTTNFGISPKIKVRNIELTSSSRIYQVAGKQLLTLQLRDDDSGKIIYIGYSYVQINNSTIEITFDTVVPDDTWCNVVVME